MIADMSGVKTNVAKCVLDSLKVLAGIEVAETGKFVIPHICSLKLHAKPALPARKRMMFGIEKDLPAKPAALHVKLKPCTDFVRGVARGVTRGERKPRSTSISAMMARWSEG